MSKSKRPAGSRQVYLEPGAYTLEAEPVLIDNSLFEAALAKRQVLIDLRRKKDAEAQARTLRLVMDRVKRRAEDMRLARERREEEARALIQGAPMTVSAELVKDEADAILREAEVKLRAASLKEEEATALILEARQMADGLMDEARRKAEDEAGRIRAQSREEGVREGREEGSKKGFDDGMAAGSVEGLKQGRARFEVAASALEAVLRDLPGKIEASLEALQADVAGAASEIAKRVIAGELVQNPGVVASIVAEALREVRDRTKVTVRVNPEDIMACRAHREEFLAILGPGSLLRVEEDAVVERGGCLIETNAGRLDATVARRVSSAMNAAGGEAA